VTLTQFSTDQTPAPHRATMWSSVIAETYFPLQLDFRRPESFRGSLSRREVGKLSVSRLTTEAMQFERRPRHIKTATEEEYLVTIPLKAPVVFRQLGREVRCDPGGFILERGDEPYRFSYESSSDLYVMKVGRAAMAERIHNPDRFCAKVFNGYSGMGALFSSMVQGVHQQGTQGDPRSPSVLTRHLLELLALSIEEVGADDPGAGSSVRAAHLRRVEQVIRDNLTNPGLSPEMIADICGISKRYLHELFKDVNGTVSQRIRDRRLLAARDMMEAQPQKSIAEIAYTFGFSEQAQFSRLFKSAFGETPSGYRASLLSR
jgi:AraC-like DNA-binding protein